MAEQNFNQTAPDKAEGFRCRLLMPVMEGNTLESEDVSSFLAGRLSVDGEDSDSRAGIRLS